ncbi:lipid A deacylase LpxR family protein [Parvularcula marina]|uniref:lipid A deacylase LpxR family protein n=1 Tax=Parvularcula marina TaxID=2292771 RepID=UPI003517DD33
MQGKLLSTGISAVVLFASAASAAADDKKHTHINDATISFTFENDYFASDDFNYTNGSKASWLSGPRPPAGLAAFAAEHLLGMGPGAEARIGFGLGQSLYTPEHTLATAPLPGEHPYAAYLYGEYTTMVEENDRLTQLTAQVGMVGPSALGEDAQNFAHRLIGGVEAEGWDNQIGDELGIAITLDQRRRIGTSIGDGWIEIDMIPAYGVTVGNVQTDVHTSLTFRIGDNLAKDYGPVRVTPGLGGTAYFASVPGFSWHVFGGFEGRAVARSIFLDGRLFSDDIVTVDKHPLVGDAQAGVVLQYDRFQLSYIHVFRSSEFENSGGSDEFGALSFAMKLGKW